MRVCVCVTLRYAAQRLADLRDSIIKELGIGLFEELYDYLKSVHRVRGATRPAGVLATQKLVFGRRLTLVPPLSRHSRVRMCLPCGSKLVRAP